MGTVIESNMAQVAVEVERLDRSMAAKSASVDVSFWMHHEIIRVELWATAGTYKDVGHDEL